MYVHMWMGWWLGGGGEVMHACGHMRVCVFVVKREYKVTVRITVRIRDRARVRKEGVVG